MFNEVSNNNVGHEGINMRAKGPCVTAEVITWYLLLA